MLYVITRVESKNSFQGHFLSGDSSIARSKDLCYNLIRKCGRLCIKNYKASAKARLRLAGIFFTHSTIVKFVWNCAENRMVIIK